MFSREKSTAKDTPPQVNKEKKPDGGGKNIIKSPEELREDKKFSYDGGKFFNIGARGNFLIFPCPVRTLGKLGVFGSLVESDSLGFPDDEKLKKILEEFAFSVPAEIAKNGNEVIVSGRFDDDFYCFSFEDGQWKISRYDWVDTNNMNNGKYFFLVAIK